MGRRGRLATAPGVRWRVLGRLPHPDPGQPPGLPSRGEDGTRPSDRRDVPFERRRRRHRRDARVRSEGPVAPDARGAEDAPRRRRAEASRVGASGVPRTSVGTAAASRAGRRARPDSRWPTPAYAAAPPPGPRSSDEATQDRWRGVANSLIGHPLVTAVRWPRAAEEIRDHGLERDLNMGNDPASDRAHAYWRRDLSRHVYRAEHRHLRFDLHPRRQWFAPRKRGHLRRERGRDLVRRGLPSLLFPVPVPPARRHQRSRQHRRDHRRSAVWCRAFSTPGSTCRTGTRSSASCGRCRASWRT